MTDIDIRPAGSDDLQAIVNLLADDELGALRESPDDLAPYEAAFERLKHDPSQFVMVAVRGDHVVGTLQLTIIPGLSRRGTTRALIEAVRVHRTGRAHGVGEQMVRWAIDESRRLGCGLVQLTSDRDRARAHRFYERLGFVDSHIGFKLHLDT